MIDDGKVVCETEGLPWTPAPEGLRQKLLACAGGPDRFTTSLWQLDPGACLAPPEVGLGIELLVLEGACSVAEIDLAQGDYLRVPGALLSSIRTLEGCTLFHKTGPFPATETSTTHIRAGQLPWQQGQGNLQVKSLFSSDGEGTALVHWPDGERFLPHKHWGGEEIFVLSGTFMDEHGRYPEGTWLRSPHLSTHHPFVERETTIFVKTGHLHPEP